MSLRFVVVTEDRLGFALATTLCDRVARPRGSGAGAISDSKARESKWLDPSGSSQCVLVARR
jgi:hypothetical protein